MFDAIQCIAMLMAHEFRLPWNLSTEIVRDVIMDHHTSGRFTSKHISQAFCKMKWQIFMNDSDSFWYYYSTLGGSHGVPRVHYKGRQGEYYIMVSWLYLSFLGTFPPFAYCSYSFSSTPSQNMVMLIHFVSAGYGYAGTELVGCME